VHPRAIFKIVCCDVDDVLEAVELFDTFHVAPDARWVMPQGRTVVELAAVEREITEAALTFKVNVSPRLQVNLWDDERGR
jgi:hypothetical protein